MTTPDVVLHPHAETIAALQRALSVVQMPDGFHVVQIPGEAGAALTHWVGPQVNLAAAEMQRSELVQAAAHGDMSGCFSGSARDFFDLAGQIEDLIANHDGDIRSLALALTREAPWERDPFDGDSTPPF
jgi:hypothetical protein